jgi:hypothetical protein
MALAIYKRTFTAMRTGSSLVATLKSAEMGQRTNLLPRFGKILRLKRQSLLLANQLLAVL